MRRSRLRHAALLATTVVAALPATATPARAAVMPTRAAVMPARAAFALVRAGGSIAATGVVATTGPGRLNTRSGPSSGSARTGSAPAGMTVKIVCQVTGQFVRGTVRATSAWDRLHNGNYITDAYVDRPRVAIPTCTRATPVKPTPVKPTPSKPRPRTTRTWTLPVTAGIVSGFRTESRPRHDGVDLGAARNTPIRAVAGGTVTRVRCNVSSGDCDVDGSRDLSGCGWYVEILHAGTIITRYCHMIRRPSVQVGEVVARGHVIGYVGSSGSSSGPHLHFEVHLNAPPATRANAVDPISFMRVKGLRFGG